jgi:hypothetical protein
MHMFTIGLDIIQCRTVGLPSVIGTQGNAMPRFNLTSQRCYRRLARATLPHHQTVEVRLLISA